MLRRILRNNLKMGHMFTCNWGKSNCVFKIPKNLRKKTLWLRGTSTWFLFRITLQLANISIEQSSNYNGNKKRTYVVGKSGTARRYNFFKNLMLFRMLNTLLRVINFTYVGKMFICAQFRSFSFGCMLTSPNGNCFGVKSSFRSYMNEKLPTHFARRLHN